MSEFTKSDFTFNGKTYKRYTADRKRAGNNWVFFDVLVEGKIYPITWAKELQNEPSFNGHKFISRINHDVICVDFETELNTSEETALDNLYEAHREPEIDL